MITVRIATVNDVPSLLPLIEMLEYPTTEQILEKRFMNFIKLDGYGVAVALAEDKVTGLIAWSKSMLFVSDAVRFHIEGLIVDENYRGQGVGKKLIYFLEKIAKNSTPSIIDLTSGLRRAKDGSHEFYQALGYKNEGHMAKLYFRKEL
jgi:GNAT superfamily N-acetyltransferase